MGPVTGFSCLILGGRRRLNKSEHLVKHFSIRKNQYSVPKVFTPNARGFHVAVSAANHQSRSIIAPAAACDVFSCRRLPPKWMRRRRSVVMRDTAGKPVINKLQKFITIMLARPDLHAPSRNRLLHYNFLCQPCSTPRRYMATLCSTGGPGRHVGFGSHTQQFSLSLFLPHKELNKKKAVLKTTKLWLESLKCSITR